MCTCVYHVSGIVLSTSYSLLMHRIKQRCHSHFTDELMGAQGSSQASMNQSQHLNSADYKVQPRQPES